MLTSDSENENDSNETQISSSPIKRIPLQKVNSGYGQQTPKKSKATKPPLNSKST